MHILPHFHVHEDPHLFACIKHTRSPILTSFPISVLHIGMVACYPPGCMPLSNHAVHLCSHFQMYNFHSRTACPVNYFFLLYTRKYNCSHGVYKFMQVHDTNLPHKVKTHFTLHTNYFFLPWKIPEEISSEQCSSIYITEDCIYRINHVHTTFYHGSRLT